MKRIFILLSVFSVGAVQSQTLTFDQVLQRVVDQYPSLQSASIAVERARQESIRVESQLGWQLAAQATVQHDMSAQFGTTVDSMRLSGNMSRVLESGDTLTWLASMNRDDAETSFPGAANPALSTHLGVNYRMPLAKGADNTSLTQSREQAQVSVLQSEAEKRAVYDQIASQLVDVYANAVATRARMDNTARAIERSQRLQRYIQSRSNLGIAEEKDVLQVNAQLKGREAELAALRMQWRAQLINLNRLMGMDANTEWQPVVDDVAMPLPAHTDLMQQSTQHSPSLAVIQARLRLADSALALSRDKRRDKLDLILFAGNKTLSGDSTPSDVDASEIVGGVTLEYARGLDLSGYDAELYQAQLQRSAAMQDQKQIMQDLDYNLNGVLAELESGQQALQAYASSYESEKKKLDEAEQRYRRGRTDTDQLIQFEAQLSQAELSRDLQRVELARRAQRLRLFSGSLWQTVKISDVDFKKE
jgi:outer membrane protein TolC